MFGLTFQDMTEANKPTDGEMPGLIQSTTQAEPRSWLHTLRDSPASWV